MKHLNLRNLAFIFLITFISINCSGGHCDDEDLNKVDQNQTLVQKHTDTLQVIND